MLVVLAPSKKQSFDVPTLKARPTRPPFADRAAAIAASIAAMDADEIASLMRVNHRIAATTRDAYLAWTGEAGAAGRPALFAYTGETYRGLAAHELPPDEITWAQDHLRILSALYGVLRPTDAIRPYRLDFTVPLRLNGATSLYDYWGDAPTRHLASSLKRSGSPDLICLASAEFARLIRADALPGRVVTPVFKEHTPRGLRSVSVYAKQARGTMARWIVRNRVNDADALAGFDLDGYRHEPDGSTADAPLFVR
ncbi:MAG: YaaA family protein [Spirochaetota bacterium]